MDLDERLEQESIRRSNLSWEMYSCPGRVMQQFIDTHFKDEAEIISAARQDGR
jgi:hypothetical protein